VLSTNLNVNDIRNQFKELKANQQYVTDKSGCQMLEIIGATFIADEPSIFGTVNEDYVKREIDWYKSMSRNVHDIPGGPPKEWVRCADSNGMINSNYGWMIWSEENHNQYERVRQELSNNPDSRRAVMIYTRPSIWDEYNTDGMSDFVCTNAVQYFIRDNKLVALVQMRSNDSIFGFKNDRAWQKHVHEMLAKDLNIEVGHMIWHAGSLHIYSRHFHLINDDQKVSS
jgi:thymidylate synthase